MNSSFQDPAHAADGMSVSRVDEKRIESDVDEQVLGALDTWMRRADKTVDDATPFTSLGLPAFCIGYEGKIIRYAPDEATNRFSEGLVRDFLFTDGICNLDRREPRLFEVESSITAIETSDLLLVLPFETASGNIAGIMVVDVSTHRAPA